MARKDYFIKVQVIDIKSDGIQNDTIINFSSAKGRENLDRLIFKAINTEKGVTIELDRTEPAGS